MTRHLKNQMIKKKDKQESASTISEEVQEFVNLTITEHMGKAYSEWKLNQDKEPVSEIDKKYQKLLETLSSEQEEVITEYCNAIFSSGADTEEFFYRLGLKRWTESEKYGKISIRNDIVKSEFIKEDMDETVFMFALFKCRKFDKRRN